MTDVTLPNSQYTVAWICALPEERTAGDAMLDATHSGPSEVHPGDDNAYRLGRIGKHNVVIVCLPLGCYGTVSAATVATQMKFTFPSLKIYLMVGIGGGIPSAFHDIRLGDIVVSKPENSLGGVVQYDLGKTVKGGHFERSGCLNKPPPLLLNAIADLKASHESGRGTSDFSDYMAEVYTKNPHLAKNYTYQGRENDTLYDADYEHEGGLTCERCLPSKSISRKLRNSTRPVVHYGIIASGNQVIKHGVTRDRIGNDTQAICFEMEAAGLMDLCPCLVIRGICDYSDNHKNKRWQPYAALAAAAYAKELLCVITDERIFDVPRILHPHFSGRRKYLDQIRDSLDCRSTDQEGAIVSVFGIPGVGKSQLTLKYAVENRSKYKYGFYTIANTVDHWLSSCDNVAQALGLPEAASTEQHKRTQALKRWLSTKRDWILIIDDVTQSVVSLLRDNLPQHLGGHILLSTRDRYIAQEFSPPTSCIRLCEMDPTEGKELILKIYSRNNSSSEIAEKISQELGGLPLALEQGTTCALQRCWELDKFFKNLQENKRVVIGSLLENPHHSDIITTLDIALTTLEPGHLVLLNLILMMNPQALPVQLLMDGAPNLESTLEPANAVDDRLDTPPQEIQKWAVRFRKRFKVLKGPKMKAGPAEAKGPTRRPERTISESLAEVLLSKLELDTAIVILERSSLVRRTQNGEVWVHDLFKELLQGKLKDEERQEFVRCAGKIISGAFPPSRHETWKICNSYLPHSLEVMALLDSCDLHTAETFETMHAIGEYYNDIGRYDDSLQWLERTIVGQEKILGKDHPSVLETIRAIGSALSMQGRYDEALPAFQRVLAGWNSIDRPEYGLKIITGVENIAIVLRKQEKYDEAMEMYQLALNAWEREDDDGKYDSRTISILEGIAICLHSQGRHDDALEYYRLVLRARETTLGKEHSLTLQTLYNTAINLRTLNKNDEALELLQRAMHGREIVLGAEHPLTLDTIFATANVLHRLERYHEAVELYERALPRAEIALGEENPLTIHITHNMAHDLIKLNKYDEALQLYERVYARKKRILGEDHLLTLEMAKYLQIFRED
ncbi:hypothetical protein TWF718_007682 [Orbilia javanica]|uniref:Uncharacterized protein n=1 Tax=Orbilia javanica TaxID=47235 RepID=A0AAN8RDE8_9PEZI